MIKKIKIKKTAIISIGDELLIGQVVNSNAAWISQYLQRFGIRISEHRAVADNRISILQAIEDLVNLNQLIIITGGLGATEDDITKEVLATLVDSELYFDQSLYRDLIQRLHNNKLPVKAAHRKLCMMPVKCTLLHNDVGAAPGMVFNYKNSYLVSLPGVPYEMQYILNHAGRSFIQDHLPDRHYFQKTILTSGIGEVSLANSINDITDRYPEFAVAYLPSFGHVRLRISAYGDDQVPSKGNALCHRLIKKLGNAVYGTDKDHITQVIGQMLLKQSKTMAVAESCTGGLISHKITQQPGSSAYYVGSVTAYSNALKKRLLRVKAQTLEDFGAVSEQTVRQMLTGILSLTGADVGIATSGIAGPGGGTEQKPVGTVWIAYGSINDIHTKHLQLNKTRIINNEFTAHISLNLLRLYLL